MGQWIWKVTASAALIIAGAGCKKQTALPMPDADLSPQSATQPSGPTTQQLLTGPRTRIHLSPLPVSIAVPSGWAVSQPPGTTFAFLQGPLPTGGEVHIQLTHKPLLWTDDKSPMTMDERLELMKQAARKEQQAQPQTIKQVDTRSLGQARVFEKQSLFQPAGGAAVDAQGHAISIAPQIRWTITLFVPHEKTYQSYELNFLDLSQHQYEANQKFLRDIIDSIQLSQG